MIIAMCLGTCVSSSSRKGVGGEFHLECAPRGIARNPSRRPGNPPLGHHPASGTSSTSLEDADADVPRDPVSSEDSTSRATSPAPVDDAFACSGSMESMDAMSSDTPRSRDDDGVSARRRMVSPRCRRCIVECARGAAVVVVVVVVVARVVAHGCLRAHRDDGGDGANRAWSAQPRVVMRCDGDVRPRDR